MITHWHLQTLAIPISKWATAHPLAPKGYRSPTQLNCSYVIHQRAGIHNHSSQGLSILDRFHQQESGYGLGYAIQPCLGNTWCGEAFDDLANRSSLDSSIPYALEGCWDLGKAQLRVSLVLSGDVVVSKTPFFRNRLAFYIFLFSNFSLSLLKYIVVTRSTMGPL